MKSRWTVVALVLLVSTSLAGAKYQIKDKDQPFSHDLLSNQTDTKQVVRLVDGNGNPLTSSDPYDHFEWTYNRSSSPEDAITGNMVHMADGYWYADFKSNITHGMVEYKLRDPSENTITEDEDLDLGNLTVEIVTDFSGTHDTDTSFDLKVNATDAWNDTWEDNADVDLYVTNGSWTSGVKQLNNKNTNEFYKNLGVSFPLTSDASYVVHANASASGQGYTNYNGSNSVLLQTSTDINGNITNLNTTSGCNNQSFFDECERGASVDTSFNVTSSSADTVELDVLLVNSSSGSWFEKSSHSLSKSGGLWEGSFTVPDVNTSKNDKKVIFRYNATKDSTFTLTRNVSYRSYSIDDDSPNSVNQGADYDVAVGFQKYFSGGALGSSRFDNATFDIDYPNSTVFKNFTLGDMTYDSSAGVFEHSVGIPADAENGSYSLAVTAFNIYGDKKTSSEAFTVNQVDASFNSSGDIDIDINKTAVHEENVTITNKQSSQNDLEVEFSGDTENLTTGNDGNTLTLDADETRDFVVEFNITRVEDYDGEIKFIDSDADFNETIDVNIDSPDCDLRNDTLCITDFSDDWLNVSRDTSGETLEGVELVYLGENGTTASIDATATGDISPYLSFDPASFDLEESQDVTLEYSATSSGVFTGEAVFESGEDELRFNTKLDSDVEATDTGISVPASLDLGYFPSGDSLAREIEVENTGDVEITGLGASSDTFSVSIESVSIAAGATETVELSLDSVVSGSGTVTVTGQADSGSAEGEVSVTANPVPDYSSQADQLSNRIASLTGRAESDSTRTQLQNLELQVSEIKSSYDQGSYQEAEQKYQDVESQLDSIERQIAGGSSSPGQDNNGTQGGFPVVPIVAALFVLLLVGFVAYTSIIPEEGDPLYSLLGE